MKKKMHACLKRRVEGYSILEISIVLVVIGVMIGGVMKGKGLLEAARLNALVSQIQSYRMAFQTYTSQFGMMPGDDSMANQSFGAAVVDGDGDGKIGGEGLDGKADAGKVWQHLLAADLISGIDNPTGDSLTPGKGVPAPKFGGVITVMEDDEAVWLLVGNPNGTKGDKPLFTPKQAHLLLKKFGVSSPKGADVQVQNGAGATACLDGDRLNLTHKRPACTLRVRL